MFLVFLQIKSPLHVGEHFTNQLLQALEKGVYRYFTALITAQDDFADWITHKLEKVSSLFKNLATHFLYLGIGR